MAYKRKQLKIHQETSFLPQKKSFPRKNYPKDCTIVSTQERYSERKLKKTIYCGKPFSQKPMPIFVSLWYTETLKKNSKKVSPKKIISTKNYPKDSINGVQRKVINE